MRLVSFWLIIGSCECFGMRNGVGFVRFNLGMFRIYHGFFRHFLRIVVECLDKVSAYSELG